MRQINSSECNHRGNSDGGGSRSGKAEGGVGGLTVVIVVVVIVVLLVIRSDTVVVVRIAGILIVRLVVFTVLIVSLTLSIFVRLLLFFFGAVVDISGAFGYIGEDIVREFGNRIGVVVLVDGDVGNLVSCLDNSVVTSVGIFIIKNS